MQETVKQLQAQLQQASAQYDDTQAATEQTMADNAALLRTLRIKLDEARVSAAADADRLQEAATHAQVIPWPRFMPPHPLPARAGKCKCKRKRNQRDFQLVGHE